MRPAHDEGKEGGGWGASLRSGARRSASTSTRSCASECGTSGGNSSAARPRMVHPTAGPPGRGDTATRRHGGKILPSACPLLAASPRLPVAASQGTRASRPPNPAGSGAGPPPRAPLCLGGWAFYFSGYPLSKRMNGGLCLQDPQEESHGSLPVLRTAYPPWGRAFRGSGVLRGLADPGGSNAGGSPFGGWLVPSGRRGRGEWPRPEGVAGYGLALGGRPRPSRGHRLG